VGLALRRYEVLLACTWLNRICANPGFGIQHERLTIEGDVMDASIVRASQTKWCSVISSNRNKIVQRIGIH
jgi:hypothetical protein